MVSQKKVKPIITIFYLSLLFLEKRNIKVISIEIPEIINHKIIEISDVLPPTKVSSSV